MDKPRDYGFTQFDSFRPHQLEVASKIATAFSSGKKFVFLEAPTGAGKTFISALVAKMMDSEMIYTCHTRTLQKQFVDDFYRQGARKLEGRANYPCLKNGDEVPVSEDNNADLCTHETPNCNDCFLSCPPAFNSSLQEVCPCKSICPYELAKAEALSAPIAVLNMPLYLLAVDFIEDFDDRRLVVLDEVDRTEEALMAKMEVYIAPSTIAKYDLGTPRYVTKSDDWVGWAERAMRILSDRMNLLSASEGITKLKEINRLRRLSSKLKFLVDESSGDWVYGYSLEGTNEQQTETVQVKGLLYKPVWVSRHSEKMLWSHAEHFLGMSATVRPYQKLCQDLCIKASEAEFIEIPSEFDVKYRSIYHYPVANMRKDSKQAEFPKLVTAIDTLLKIHSNEKGLIHCVSYSNMNYILENSKYSQRMITHNTQNCKQKLIEFINSSEPVVMLSPAMERGIDLPYDSCRFIIIAKMPFPCLGDPQVKARRFTHGKGESDSRGREWYATITARRLVQATGRGMRSSDDFCVSYILDSAFEKFYGENLNLFSPWWREAVRRPKELEVLLDEPR